MSDANKDLVRRMEDEIFNKRHPGAVDEFLAPDYVLRSAAEGTPAGREVARAAIGAYIDGFSDLRVEVEELIAEGDRVVAVLRYSGTNDGHLFGMPATQRSISVRQIAVYRVKDGKVVEEWEVSDQMGLMQQLGVMPEQ